MSSPVNPGDILMGKYRIDRLLGMGGMGVVVAATHLGLEQRVAIKFMLANKVASREQYERFLREARAAVRLKSEHVARVSDVGTMATGAPYMVMEYLDGRDLSAILEDRGPFPIAEAIDHVLQACEAVGEAHVAGSFTATSSRPTCS
jgi:serine/threonine-protein kinase